MKLASPIEGILLTEPDVVAALIQAQKARIRRTQTKIEEAEARSRPCAQPRPRSMHHSRSRRYAAGAAV
jgi:hypothetical protein